MSTETGTKHWSAKVSGPLANSPISADGIVYYAARNGTVYAFDASSGQAIWTRTVGAEVPRGAVVGDGVVIVAAKKDTPIADEGTLYALRPYGS
ncbi:PQQ-binding-like beta-propeller repeat protein [Streptomyces sp. NPDC087300]|uniref:outer membrane protein assembly factor BamB family protein n=1 Tax=Streptomyces sp. NPDC087300 TaxID=3365780 RepID=UPI003819B6B3